MLDQNPVTELDILVSESVNAFAGRSWTLDWLMTTALGTPTLKLLPIVTCLVWVWFAPFPAARGQRAAASGLIGAFLALVVSRLIQNSSPERPRPLHDPTLDITTPLTIAPDTLVEWSSFPSDNAALAFALTAGVWLASRRLGIPCAIWATFAVALPRIYAGFHFLSDILGGALLGIACVLLVARAGGGTRALKALARLEPRFPGVTGVLLFLVLFQVTIMFDDVRRIARVLADIL